MAPAHDKSPAKPAGERRTGSERRRREDAPTAGWERRRGIEPRKPEVVELDVTVSEWDALHADVPPQAEGGSGKRR